MTKNAKIAHTKLLENFSSTSKLKLIFLLLQNYARILLILYE